MSLGDIIRTQRKKINLTLPQLAELSDVSKGVISKIETEETKRPDFKTIYAIGRALNMTYEDIVKIYLTFETRSDFLMNILKQSVTESPYLCSDIAKRFLNDFQRDCYELVDELYSFIETILNPTIQLNLYKLIITYTRSHGIQTYFAKALLSEYLIERDDFSHLHSTYNSGRQILEYTEFLTTEEKSIFYYKLGMHAYHLNKFKEAIECFKKAEDLNIKDDELKSQIYILFCSSYIHLGKLDIAELYLAMFKNYDFPFIRENVDFLKGQLNIKSGNINMGILQLQQCLSHNPPKIEACNVLLDLYFGKKDWESVEKLIEEENFFINFKIQKPIYLAAYAAYYEKKGKYYNLKNFSDKYIECLFKSATIYTKIDMHSKAYDCLELICRQNWNEKIKILFQEFKQQHKKGVLT